MKPLPKLDDDAAMLARGRRSAIHAARNEACEALRDAVVACQSMPIGESDKCLDDAEAAIKRLRDIAALWAQYEGKA